MTTELFGDQRANDIYRIPGSSRMGKEYANVSDNADSYFKGLEAIALVGVCRCCLSWQKVDGYIRHSVGSLVFSRIDSMSNAS